VADCRGGEEGGEKLKGEKGEGRGNLRFSIQLTVCCTRGSQLQPGARLREQLRNQRDRRNTVPLSPTAITCMAELPQTPSGVEQGERQG